MATKEDSTINNEMKRKTKKNDVGDLQHEITSDHHVMPYSLGSKVADCGDGVQG
jgi:hypothetical protein